MNYKVEFDGEDSQIVETEDSPHWDSIFLDYESAEWRLVDYLQARMESMTKTLGVIVYNHNQREVNKTVTLQISGGIIEVIDSPNDIRVDVVLHDYDIEGVVDDDRIEQDQFGTEYLRREL